MTTLVVGDMVQIQYHYFYEAKITISILAQLWFGIFCLTQTSTATYNHFTTNSVYIQSNDDHNI